MTHLSPIVPPPIFSSPCHVIKIMLILTPKNILKILVIINKLKDALLYNKFLKIIYYQILAAILFDVFLYL